MWTLDQALAVVREFQPLAWPMGYHITLGGGVLNNGKSDKDLDLYFLSMSGEQEPTPVLIAMLEERWGASQPIIADAENVYEWDGRFRELVKFHTDGKRIDVFIQ